MSQWSVGDIGIDQAGDKFEVVRVFPDGDWKVRWLELEGRKVGTAEYYTILFKGYKARKQTKLERVL